MVQGGMSIIKNLMIVFNFIFVVCGIGLIATGVIFLKTDNTIPTISKNVAALWILIVVGVIILLLAGLGFLGAVKENYCLLMTFGILLLLIFVIEIAAAVTVYMNKSNLEGLLKKQMNSTFQKGIKDTKFSFDDMQSHFKCCGVDGVDDWPEDEIPKSCCPKGPEAPEACTKERAFKKGCYQTFGNKMKKNVETIGGVAVGLAVVELIGMIISWCLASAIKKECEKC